MCLIIISLTTNIYKVHHPLILYADLHRYTGNNETVFFVVVVCLFVCLFVCFLLWYNSEYTFTQSLATLLTFYKVDAIARGKKKKTNTNKIESKIANRKIGTHKQKKTKKLQSRRPNRPFRLCESYAKFASSSCPPQGSSRSRFGAGGWSCRCSPVTPWRRGGRVKACPTTWPPWEEVEGLCCGCRGCCCCVEEMAAAPEVCRSTSCWRVSAKSKKTANSAGDNVIPFLARKTLGSSP